MDIQTLTHITPDANYEELWLALQQDGSAKKSKKIGEFKSSVSSLAMNLLMPVESDDILERRKLVVDYLKLILDPVHLEGLAAQFDMHMADENTSNADLRQYIKETRAYREHGFLEALDAQIGEEAMNMTRVVLERFGNGIKGIRGVREEAAGSVESQDPVLAALKRHGVVDPEALLLSEDGKGAAITGRHGAMLGRSST